MAAQGAVELGLERLGLELGHVDVGGGDDRNDDDRDDQHVLGRLLVRRDEVDALNTRFANRVFVLPNFKASNLNRDLEAYLKPQG